jgi:hypothetical protein
VVIELPEEDVEQVDDDFDPLAEKDFMKLEAEVADGVAEPSRFPMPQSWQEYQSLQDQLGSYTTSDKLDAVDRAEAAKHEANLVEFYASFKDILAEGWKLLNNVMIEDAVSFLAKVKKLA